MARNPHTYNSLLQMTRMTAPGMMDMQYNYTAGQNNGRIASSVDGVPGETVNYTYDSLNRLAGASATNGSWGQAFTYDGFGNLTGKTVTSGSAPSLNVQYDAATNHEMGMSYDANGNVTSAGEYDVENRLVTAANGERYSYGPDGKRVVKRWADGSGGELYFYGITGQKLATYSCYQVYGDLYCGGSSPQLNVYFRGKLAKSKGVAVVTDRLGSVRANGNGETMSYFPYGEERTSTADNREKFGTYTRDSAGQDYADQRYYAVGRGRFQTADPYVASATSPTDPSDPSTWNRYTYVANDPVTFGDPTGLDKTDFVSCTPGVTCFSSVTVAVAPSGPSTGGGSGAGGGSGSSFINLVPTTVGSSREVMGGDAGMFMPELQDGERSPQDGGGGGSSQPCAGSARGVGFGWTVSSAAGFGTGPNGGSLGATASAGGGTFFAGLSQTNGAFASAGAFSSHNGNGPSYPPLGNGVAQPGAYGATVGAGAGAFVTNAGNGNALGGSFSTIIVGFGPWSIDLDRGGGVWVLSLTLGVGRGLPISLLTLQTNTYQTGCQ